MDLDTVDQNEMIEELASRGSIQTTSKKRQMGITHGTHVPDVTT